MAWSYAVLAPVSKCYPPVRDRLLTRYSPVRHSNMPLPAVTFRGISPFDLHVLSTPPAFVLSQDQTLMFNPSPLPRPLYSLRLAKASPFALTLPWRFNSKISDCFAARLPPDHSRSPPLFPSGLLRSAKALFLLFSVSFSRFVRAVFFVRRKRYFIKFRGACQYFYLLNNYFALRAVDGFQLTVDR